MYVNTSNHTFNPSTGALQAGIIQSTGAVYSNYGTNGIQLAGNQINGLSNTNGEIAYNYAGTASINHSFYNGSNSGGVYARIGSGGLSVGTGTLPSGGGIYATGEITAYYSDARLKTNLRPIADAMNIVNKITGFYYTPNDLAVQLLGEETTNTRIGLLAQDVIKVLPEVVKPAPFDLDDDLSSKSGENYITVQYEKLVPVLVEAIKELNTKLCALQTEIFQLKSNS